jgi:F-type H+-transporting ATPase subunit epsilon
MADQSFHLEIITPRRVVYKGEVVSFSAPGVVGGFQVLKNHAPLLSSIQIGEVKITDTAGLVIRFATSGGFVEVHQNKVVFLAETAEVSGDIDVERAKAAHERAKQRLHDKGAGINIGRAAVALERAFNRLHIAEKQI